MSTEPQVGKDGEAVGEQAQSNGRSEQTLSVTDNRTGRDLRAADHRWHRARDGPSPDQDRRGGLRADGLRPGLHQHRVVPQFDHLHRRRGRHPPASWLPDRAAVRALELPRGGLPTDQRPLPTRQSSTGGSTRSRSTRSCTRTSRTSCRASATTPTRWACSWLPSGRSRPSTPMRTRSTSERARDPDHPPAREDADARGVRLPPQHGSALRLPRQRPRLRGQLPRDDVQDDRAQVRARSAAGSGRSTYSSSCTPTTNRTPRRAPCARSALPR